MEHGKDAGSVLLLAEVTRALGMLEAASSSDDPDQAARSRASARRIYEALRRFLPSLKLDEGQSRPLQLRLDELGRRLDVFDD